MVLQKINPIFRLRLVNKTQSSPLLKAKSKLKWYSWILLILVIVNGACVGPFFLYLDCNNLLKSSWRLMITSILLIPFVLHEYYFNPIQRAMYIKSNLTKKATLFKIFISTFANSFWTTAFVYSLRYTSVSHAALLGNCHSLIIVIYKILKGDKVTHIEITGAIISFIGAGIVVQDQKTFSNDTSQLDAIPFFKRLLFGDLLAFSGSIAATIFFVVSRQVRNEYPLYFRITLMALCGSINMGIMSVLFEGSTLTFDPNIGLFGLFTAKRFPFFIFLGIVIGLGVFVLYVVITNIMDPLIVSVALFFEPVVSAILVWILGMQTFPGLATWVGTLIVIPGMIMITVSQSKRYSDNLDPEKYEAIKAHDIDIAENQKQI